eukprot:TRINITY_DN25576_c0_g1_i1.p2 TRINITY_DN25576_c0_g1~~TRINITY_DN25576_c0_g1_i1.p2  ORF type:complete len:180 (-),score=40.40 TRINITY_DN25576_c0_g1_i1:454-993(-)
MSILRATLLLMFTVAFASADPFRLIQANDIAGLKTHLSDHPEALSLVGNGGQSPLMFAVLSGQTAAVEVILSFNPDTSIGEKDGYTPMHGAGFQGRAKIAKLLIAHGLDPSEMHADGFTPIHRACWGKEPRHTATVKALLEAGVSPSERSRDGKVPVDLTSNQGTIDLLVKFAAAQRDL